MDEPEVDDHDRRLPSPAATIQHHEDHQQDRQPALEPPADTDERDSPLARPAESSSSSSGNTSRRISLVRTRSDIEEEEERVAESLVLSSPTRSSAPEEQPRERAHKRQRTEYLSTRATVPSLADIDRTLLQTPTTASDESSYTTPSSVHPPPPPPSAMRLAELDERDQPDAQAGPSSLGLDGAKTTVAANGHGGTANGYSSANGHETLKAHSGPGSSSGKASGSAIARVSLPGSTLYEDSFVDREEFVRLVIQSLRDVGYIESAATLEAESGYTMESPEVAEFRRCILDASWAQAEAALMRLGMTSQQDICEVKFLINQQKYLELLEVDNTPAALHVLRTEIAPLNVDANTLRSLSSLMMSPDAADLRRRAQWDGAAGTSRRKLLLELQRFIPSSLMIPPRRLPTLLSHALLHQRSQCAYHNAPLRLDAPNDPDAFSLYRDHACEPCKRFPSVTSTILEGHGDEVWAVEWSRDGRRLASAGQDRCAVVWRIGPEKDSLSRTYTAELILRDHSHPIGYLAWSMDDSVLLTASEHIIKMWNTKTGVCIRALDNAHTETVTSLAWLPDGSGFMSGGLDRKIIIWDAEGRQRDAWGPSIPVRITDLAVTPDCTRVVAVGMNYLAASDSAPSGSTRRSDTSVTPPTGGGGAHPNGSENAGSSSGSGFRMIVYDLPSKQIESSIRMEGELTSVKISRDSRFALVNQAPDEVLLWDLETGRIARKFTGQRQGRHVIRSCFGGVDGNFIVSGSEDGNVYIWQRDTGVLLDVLSGHGSGSVNSVAWNPRNERMFASCSDDRTIRIWEAPESVHASQSVTTRSSEAEADGLGKGKGKSRERWEEEGDVGRGQSEIGNGRSGGTSL